jgi:transcriptional regulator NrdR family protein
MRDTSERPPDSADHVGLRCRRCGHRKFRVLYTRPGRAGMIMRRRACRHCGERLTTWERPVGG